METEQPLKEGSSGNRNLNLKFYGDLKEWNKWLSVKILEKDFWKKIGSGQEWRDCGNSEKSWQFGKRINLKALKNDFRIRVFGKSV